MTDKDRTLDELGNWRPERNKFTSLYFQMYHSHTPKSQPEEDYEDRNALYALYAFISTRCHPLADERDVAGGSICTRRHCFRIRKRFFECK